jgi:3-deoxy-7-phosphoheptulonate synthase
MPPYTDDLRIRSFEALSTPAEVLGELPCSESMSETVASARAALHAILHGTDDRLAVVIGPCSIHDAKAALEYAKRLRPLRDELGDALEIVMRVYFEKPRTTVGWKGLINDPDLDGTFKINKGLRLARGLLCEINALGLPAGVEYLDVISPQYISDLVAWGAIGARTTESQVHREMASGLSCPIGFKNGTDGNVKIAVDAVGAAAHPHHFLAVTKEGRATVAATAGNPDGHVILRGGKEPNYEAADVAAACELLAKAALEPRLMIDASHANSGKQPENQPRVAAAIAAQIEAGERRIVGVMVESHLVGGRQDLVPGGALRYGQSITDGCLEWEQSTKLLDRLARAVRARRAREPAAALGEARGV